MTPSAQTMMPALPLGLRCRQSTSRTKFSYMLLGSHLAGGKSGAADHAVFGPPGAEGAVDVEPTGEVLAVEKVSAVKLGDVDVFELELAAAGYFGLNGDDAFVLLQSFGFPGGLAVDSSLAVGPDDGELHLVPLARLGEALALRPGRLLTLPSMPLSRLTW